MAKCYECGKSIKRVYTFNGQTYGIECWKRVALPEIEKQRQEQREEKEQLWKEKCWILVQVLKAKDMKRIKNEFKKKVIPQLINQFETEGWLSKKQYDMVWDWLNNKDYLMMTDIEYELGYYEDDERHYYERVAWYATGKRKKEAEAIVAQYEEIERDQIKEKKKEKIKAVWKEAIENIAVDGELKEILIKWITFKLDQLDNLGFEEISSIYSFELDNVKHLALGNLSPKCAYGKRFIEKMKEELQQK